jgi:hypothetical protein
MQTTTVRVDIDARQRLSDLATGAGMSAAAYLDKLINDAWWDAAVASELEALAADRVNPAVAQEDADWETATSDGLG